MVGLYCSYNYLLSLCKENVVVCLFRGRSESWWSEVVLKTFTERQWIENFRMSHRTFLHLCDQLHPKLFRSDTHYIPVKKRVAIALWFLATPGEYRTIAHLFGVARCTVCVIVNEVCRAIDSILRPQYISFPRGEELKAVVEGFENEWGVPQFVSELLMALTSQYSDQKIVTLIITIERGGTLLYCRV